MRWRHWVRVRTHRPERRRWTRLALPASRKPSVTTPASSRPTEDDKIATQQLIARRLGDRLSILRAFARSERQATTDPLTGLLNRRSLEDRMPATAADPAGYAVAYLDLDRFKQLNDTHGHAAGDRALRAFATTLRRRLRPRDLIGRWGGEEFLAVLPDCDRARPAP